MKLYNSITNAIRWVLIFGGAIGVMWLLNRPESPERKAARQAEHAQAVEIIDRAVAASQKPTWQTVETEKATGDTYEMTLVYRNVPDSYATVDADTRSLISAVLAELKSAGEIPTQKLVQIFVFTKRNVSGETGKQLVQDFGWASYNSDSDQIVFKRP